MQLNQHSTNNQGMGCLTKITTIELPKQTLFDVLNEKNGQNHRLWKIRIRIM